MESVHAEGGLARFITSSTLYCPASLRLVFIMPRPKRLTHRANGGTLAASKPEVTPPHTSAPDVSNLAKAVEDALEKAGILANDSQINSLRASKRYAEVGEDVGIVVELEW
jgi:Holliday junction resolvase RusA-like endonuclease